MCLVVAETRDVMTYCVGRLMQPSCRQGVCLSPSVELGLTDIEMGGGGGGDDDEPVYDDPWDMVRSPFLSGLETEYDVSESDHS